MSDSVTWPMVWMALIAASPGILGGIVAAIVALKAVNVGRENRTALAVTALEVEKVHTLVNSRFTEVQSKLDAALGEIGRLKGQPPQTVAEAPTTPPPSTFKDTA
ncbi:MAG: hypothetical protein Q7T33_03545 [Dehalococcoidia bacterium]|nr:hypothetical protein [Dehalococcoidia bacterium]